MLRNLWFQIHWFVGISMGAVLSFSGLTGGLMAFGPELTHYFSGGSQHMEGAGLPLSASALYQRVHARYPQRTVVDLTTYADAQRPAMVHFAVPSTFIGPTAPIAETRMLNPYSGELLPARAFGHALERFMFWLHEVHQGHWGPPGARGPAVGANLVGLGSVLLFVMALSGLYLRWPRGRAARRWQSWLRIYPQLHGRAFLFNLHSVLGTCVLLVYLVSAHSGAFQNGEMGWYGSSVRKLFGLPQVPEQGPPPGTPGAGGPPRPPGPDSPGFGPPSAGKVQLIEMPANGFVDADGDQVNARILLLDPRTGVVSAQPPDPVARTFGEALAANNQLIHEGRILGRAGTTVVACAALCLPLFYVTGWMMYLRRRGQRARVPAREAPAAAAP